MEKYSRSRQWFERNINQLRLDITKRLTKTSDSESFRVDKNIIGTMKFTDTNDFESYTISHDDGEIIAMYTMR